MADIVFNVAKGRVNEFTRRVDSNDPANSAFVVVLLKTVEADAALRDYATLGALLGAGGGATNVEADFTNYARKVLTDADISAPTVDNAADEQWSDIPDLVYTAAGGASNNTLVKAVICYDPDSTGGTDADLIPMTAHDVSATTDGNDLTLTIPANGFYAAT